VNAREDARPTTSLGPFDVLVVLVIKEHVAGDGDGEFDLYPGVGNITTPHSASGVSGLCRCLRNVNAWGS
jgi:hypothetical protein